MAVSRRSVWASSARAAAGRSAHPRCAVLSSLADQDSWRRSGDSSTRRSGRRARAGRGSSDRSQGSQRMTLLSSPAVNKRCPSCEKIATRTLAAVAIALFGQRLASRSACGIRRRPGWPARARRSRHRRCAPAGSAGPGRSAPTANSAPKTPGPCAAARQELCSSDIVDAHHMILPSGNQRRAHPARSSDRMPRSDSFLTGLSLVGALIALFRLRPGDGGQRGFGVALSPWVGDAIVACTRDDVALTGVVDS